MKNRPERKFFLALGLLTLCGLALRLRGLSVSLTADEVSALLRLQFPTFSEMIEGGTRPDGHPAFTQVFLWSWTKLFGDSEVAVRLPFALFGTASIWLSGIVAKKWFGSGTALATAAGLAFLQFPLMYSQLARPYAPGLFFTLLAAWFWTSFVMNRKVRRIDIAGFALAAALAAYSHYFSLLTTTLLALAGIFFATKENRLRYLVSCGAAVALFLPHLGITLDQLAIGGIGGPGGWLGKPEPSFVWQHLLFAFDGSRGMVWGVLGICVLTLVVFFKRPGKFHALAFLLWALPLAIGYVYSVIVNPLLQNSVLLFGFPFLLMFLFAWIPDLREKKISFVFPAGIALVFLLYVTVYKSFQLLDHFGRLKELVTTTLAWQHKYCVPLGAAYNVDAPFFVEYYYERLEEKPAYVHSTINNGFDELKDFRKQVQDAQGDYFAYGWSTKYSPLEIFPIIREKFPVLVEQRLWFNSGIYLFSKKAESIAINEDDTLFFSKNEFLPPSEYKVTLVDKDEKTAPEVKWSLPCPVFLRDSTALKIARADTIQDAATSSLQMPYTYMWSMSYATDYDIRLDSTCVYGPALKMKVGDILPHPDNQILFSTRIKQIDTSATLILVIEFQRDGKQLYWNGMESTTQIDTRDTQSWQPVYFGLYPPADLRAADVIHFYCYTKTGAPVVIDYLEVKTTNPTPVISPPPPA